MLAKSAVTVNEGSIKDVQIVTGITDFDRLFKKSISDSLTGLSAAKEIRVSADNLRKIQVFCKYDTSQDGWYPKPFQKMDYNNWNRVFQHEDPEQGIPISVEESACFERGYKQHWKYNVSYAGE